MKHVLMMTDKGDRFKESRFLKNISQKQILK